jgi:hypothetical protein
VDSECNGPYNQSAWVATKGANLQFGCKAPFRVSVDGAAPSGSGYGSGGSPSSPGAPVGPTVTGPTSPQVRMVVGVLLSQLTEVAAPAVTVSLLHAASPPNGVGNPRATDPEGSSAWLMAVVRAAGG